MVTVQQLTDKMNKIGRHKCLEFTSNAEKVISAKVRLLGDNWIKCPCEPDNAQRYCVSDLCLKEIHEQGTCHCGCWKDKSSYSDQSLETDNRFSPNGTLICPVCGKDTGYPIVTGEVVTAPKTCPHCGKVVVVPLMFNV